MENKTKMMTLCLLFTAFICPVFSGEWKATVPRNLKVLVKSCVVIPCSFTQDAEDLPHSRLRGIWHLKEAKDQNIFHEDQTQILENFRGRTKLLGNLGYGNCTLEIEDMKDHDNGPFCFRVELVPTGTQTSKTNKFSFVEDCVSFKMISDPPKPTLIKPSTPIQGHPYSIICSVSHTCPSHRPKLTWNRGSADEIFEYYRETQEGVWEVQSVLTFIPEEKDDYKEVRCEAEFHGQKKSSVQMTLNIKRSETYNHIIIPAAVAIATALIFGGLCIFMVKRYKNRIAELQRQDGTMWNRLSRMSRRIRSHRPGRSHTNQSNATFSADQKTSKPRFPSPKSQPKSYSHKEDLDDDGDDYMNTADLNVYGNL